jgi:hypothetical protein
MIDGDLVRLRVRDAFTPDSVDEAQSSVVMIDGDLVRLRVRDAFTPDSVDEARSPARSPRKPSTRRGRVS